ncbi:MAG TPA: BON domain-containing protein [Bryobacteraceae bacterium]|jgi:osmotically-inducible protein OsmY|nr:BON domain-containing protein [Bryobacteraceae bacterium]
MQRLLSVMLCLPLLLAALATPARARSSSTAAAQRTGAVSDSQIEATIRTKLAKSKIGRDGFRFKVQRGVVTWEGTTSVMQHKGSATRMARSAGAVQVVNNIKISGSGQGFTSLKKAYVKP